MEERTVLIGTNLRKMYVSDVVALVGVIAAFVCILVTPLAVIALIVAVVAAIINVLALMKLREAHDDYSNAFLYVVLGIVASFFDGGEGVIAILAGLAGEIFGLLKIYYIIKATNALLEGRNLDEIIAKGNKAWKFVLVAGVLGVIISALTAIAPTLALVLGIVGMVVSIISLVFQLGYLKAASEVW